MAVRLPFDRNANGPALRVGGWDVEMPAWVWGDSCCGVSVATEKAITSCINAVYLTANQRNAERTKRSPEHAYAMLGEAAMKSGSSVVGDGWIAAVNSFDAHLGLYGDLSPDTSPWRRTDVWFANADGAVGVLGLRCTWATTARGIELWVSTNAKEPSVGPASVVFPDFTLQAESNDLGPGTVAEGHTTIVWFPVAGTDARTYAAGQAFTARMHIQRPGRPSLSIRESDAPTAGLRVVEILKDGAAYARLLYNSTSVPQRHDGKRIAPGALVIVE